eukprot:SAG31_NODE_7305_length_1724_cov_1.775385_3_plen_119_part_01
MLLGDRIKIALRCRYETTDDFESSGSPPVGSQNTACASGACCLIRGCQGLRTRPFMFTTVGTVLAAMAAAMQGATSALEISDNRTFFPSNPEMCGGAKPDGRNGTVCYPSLLAWQFFGS